MSIFEDIDSYVSPVVDTDIIYYDGLPDLPIDSIAISLGVGQLVRRQKSLATLYKLSIAVRDEVPENARTLSKTIFDRIDGSANFFINGNGYISILAAAPTRIIRRGTGGDVTYVTVYDLIKRGA